MQDLYGSSIGSTIKAKELLTHLELLGHSVFYFWRYENQNHTGSVDNRSDTVSFWKKPAFRRLLFTPKELLKNLVELFREARFIKQNKPDIIIFRLDAYRYSLVLLSKILKIPLLVEADGAMSYEWLTYSNKDGIIWKSVILFVENFCLKSGRKIFVQSNTSKQYYLDKHHLPSEKIAVITNAARIEKENTHPELLRGKLDIPSDSVVIGFMGSFHFWHGVSLQTVLVEHVMNNYDHVYFLFIGNGGPVVQQLRNTVKENGWSSKVKFIDFVPHDELYKYVDVFDIALAPYSDKNLFYYSPVKLFEYMVRAKPVLTVKVGQIAEIVTDGQNGLFFNPNDIEDLYSKIDRLISDPDLRMRMGIEAQNVIQKDHTWPHKAAQLQKICYEMLNNH